MSRLAVCWTIVFMSLLLLNCGSSGGNGGGGGGTQTVANCGSGTPVPASNQPVWAQWGANPQHTGDVSVTAQQLTGKLADIQYDPFVARESAETRGILDSQDLLAHYQAPLTDGSDVYVMMKMGTYQSCDPVGSWTTGAACGPNTWSKMGWCEARYTWTNGALTEQWAFESDWKPEPNGTYNGVPGYSSLGLQNWEPVFHPVLANSFLYVPGAGGAIWKVDKDTGASVSNINPWSGVGGVVAANTYVSGPLAADTSGNIFYNAIQFADPSQGNVWANDIVNAWLVEIAPDDTSRTVAYSSLAPAVGGGSQRPGINVVPAIASDGTIYTTSRSHTNGAQSYLVSVNPQTLAANWAVPLNAPGPAVIVDEASSSPSVAPDGSVIYGVLESTSFGKGHTVHFDASGNFLNSYPWGWDETPAIWPHDGTYSILMKDSDSNATNFYITQMDANMNVEWQFWNTDGDEFCVNMVAIDSAGNVFANSEDGSLYEIGQGNSGIFTTPLTKIFLVAGLGAAYTPLSIGQDGKIYTQNSGHLIVVGD